MSTSSTTSTGLRLDRKGWFLDTGGQGKELDPVIIKNGWEEAIPQIAEPLAYQQNFKHNSRYYERYLKQWVKWINANGGREVAK
jgi:hypothetical protein